MNLGSQPTIDPLLPSAVEVHLINKDIIIKISSRRLGVGCDQLLIIKKLDKFLQNE